MLGIPIEFLAQCNNFKSKHINILTYNITQYHSILLLLISLIPPQHSHTETPTHIETRTHDQCCDTVEKSQAPDDGCINVRNMLNIEEVT